MGSIFKKPIKKSPGYVFIIQYRDGDRTRQERIKWARTEADAKAALAKRETSARENQERGYFGGVVDVKTTFGEIAERFMEYSRKRKRSWERDAGLIKRLNEKFQDVRAASIKPSMIESYIAERREAGASPSTVNKELTAMKTVYNHAIKDGMLEYNPVRMVKKLIEDNIRDRVLTADEFQAYLDAAPAWLREMAIIAANTGMRRGELLGLDWTQVDLKGGWITLTGNQTKNQEGRVVPLSKPVILSFNRLKGSAAGKIGPVFLKEDGRRMERFRHYYHHKATCQRAELNDFRWHDFRHCFVTMMRKAGKQDRALMKIVGHKTDSMLRRYDKVDREDLMTAIDGVAFGSGETYLRFRGEKMGGSKNDL